MMNLDIIGDKENPLFKRRELVALVNYGSSATPSKAVMQKTVADQFKVSPENVEVTKILSEVGMSKGKAWLKIWHDKKVPIYGQEKAAEQKPAEEAK
jgi:ribosomal protein S24E